jgi:hypothetical protein
MSTADTMTPVVSVPWLDAKGNPTPVRALPGLHPEAIQALECSFPGIISPEFKRVLETCCGLAETQIGSIDFTGCWFPEEPCRVFQPCLTLAIDDAGRRWVGEIGERDLPGPIWCVFPDPKVAVYVSDDLAAFIATLRGAAYRGETLKGLQDLSAQARTVWSRRHALARRPYELHESDGQLRSWLAGLPFDAYVYDLRTPTIARGWPYGLAGPSGRLYRCGRLPVFAVAGAPSEGWRQTFSATVPPTYPGAKARAVVADFPALRNGRKPRLNPVHPHAPAIGRALSKRRTEPTVMRVNTRRRKLGSCRYWPWMWGGVSVCGVIPEAVANDLVPTIPSAWAAAAALTLTLITAVKGSQR